MEIKKVYLIFDSGKITKDDIVLDLKEEGYPHIFCYGNNVKMDEKEFNIRVSDEIWTFGDCSEILDYKISKELGKDIWKMR